MSLRVCVLDYEMSNLRSAVKALERLGSDVHMARAPEDIADADVLVLPGDGHFAEAMRRLTESGLADAVVTAAGEGTRVLGICIGLQVLFDASDEAPGVPGLGLIPGRVRRLGDTAKVPHIGWSAVTFNDRCPITPGDEAEHAYYFLHSYAVEPDEPEACWAEADHGGAPFCAIAGHGNVVGFQFHPEKSSDAGIALLRHWVETTTAEVGA